VIALATPLATADATIVRRNLRQREVARNGNAWKRKQSRQTPRPTSKRSVTPISPATTQGESSQPLDFATQTSQPSKSAEKQPHVSTSNMEEVARESKLEHKMPKNEGATHPKPDSPSTGDIHIHTSNQYIDNSEDEEEWADFGESVEEESVPTTSSPDGLDLADLLDALDDGPVLDASPPTSQ